ncbi:prepilin-type N-terminal cleavage/methylation domain-containing protein [Coraliomargarita sp. SDUM461004]|uniref:Prepilin-type N-terminal cleavage/methylation domain-containing protein n=1 Tax=Thalassobacterium sedimentorum TaxID=3041258 RepID=A0ABU1AKJ6_9BACT|nr:prepilin-type N-terminal cleavage/methylation domain-containing protein [Coraliomargarita sp. SDUM461004]MDQ8194703.1 prepilin-type N-terminal cleavage/methylation domain-containing protein [Coraliomargarita sp. SDUM461004]
MKQPISKHSFSSASVKGFTLIELLMVIAIIGILAGILIPTVGAVRKQANIAASKSQLSNYVTAITMFKGEYGYYPFVTGSGTTDVTVELSTDSVDFIKTLSGRDPDSSTNAKVAFGGNRRMIAFHSFSDSEFYYDNDTEVVSSNQLADRFNNTNIKILIDANGDGRLTVPVLGQIKAGATAYVLDDPSTEEEEPDYYLND